MLSVTGVILAGGQGTRMNGLDKGLVEYQGLPLIEHVLKRFESLECILINQNRSANEYRRYALSLVEDEQNPHIGPSAGPLLGILSSLQKVTTPWAIFSPCDTPLLPDDFVQRMCTAIENSANEGRAVLAAVAFDGEFKQPLHLLINTKLEEDLRMFLLSGKRKTQEWLKRIQPIKVDFSDQHDAFKNINRMEDM